MPRFAFALPTDHSLSHMPRALMIHAAGKLLSVKKYAGEVVYKGKEYIQLKLEPLSQ
jgi:hypothetical protein